MELVALACSLNKLSLLGLGRMLPSFLTAAADGAYNGQSEIQRSCLSKFDEVKCLCRDLRKLKAHRAAAEGHTLQRADGGNGRFHSIEVDEANEPVDMKTCERRNSRTEGSEHLETLLLGAALDASNDDVSERTEHLHKVTFSDN